jgi:type II secretory pathway pseudopilin PulG
MNRHANVGISLIEVLLGAIIVSIVAVGLFQAFRIGMGNVYYLSHKRVALDLAQASMEEAKGTGYDGLPVPSTVTDYINIDGVAYTRIRRISWVADWRPDGVTVFSAYKRIGVSVIWDELEGARDVYLETFLWRLGP